MWLSGRILTQHAGGPRYDAQHCKKKKKEPSTQWLMTVNLFGKKFVRSHLQNKLSKNGFGGAVLYQLDHLP
jgi:hypothetical protein